MSHLCACLSDSEGDSAPFHSVRRTRQRRRQRRLAGNLTLARPQLRMLLTNLGCWFATSDVVQQRWVFVCNAESSWRTTYLKPFQNEFSVFVKCDYGDRMLGCRPFCASHNSIGGVSHGYVDDVKRVLSSFPRSAAGIRPLRAIRRQTAGNVALCAIVGRRSAAVDGSLIDCVDRTGETLTLPQRYKELTTCLLTIAVVYLRRAHASHR